MDSPAQRSCPCLYSTSHQWFTTWALTRHLFPSRRLGRGTSLRKSFDYPRIIGYSRKRVNTMCFSMIVRILSWRIRNWILWSDRICIFVSFLFAVCQTTKSSHFCKRIVLHWQYLNDSRVEKWTKPINGNSQSRVATGEIKCQAQWVQTTQLYTPLYHALVPMRIGKALYGFAPNLAWKSTRCWFP